MSGKGALHAGTVAESLEASGFAVRWQIIWDKIRLVIGREIIIGKSRAARGIPGKAQNQQSTS